MDNFATKAFAIFIFLTSTMGILSLIISMVVEKDNKIKSHTYKNTFPKTNPYNSQTTPSSFDEVIVIFPEEDDF